ncbi:MAG: hypothetical protein JW940_25675 [Polyangiaceae bacterium]|nr:hypothetical protein [Polyangiaceae bacterium]
MPQPTTPMLMACLLGTARLAFAEPCQAPGENTAPVVVELERPNVPNRRSRPEGDVQASMQDEELARWNIGGNGDPSYLSSRPRFHPGARVVVDARVLGAWARRGSVASVERLVQARARSKGYWPLRVCYEAALRRDPKLTVDHLVRLSATRAGRVRAVHAVRALQDAELQSCLSDKVLGLELRELPARRIDAELRIRFWPGDVPLPAWDPGSDPSLDPPELSASLGRADRLWQAARSQLVACAEQGWRRDPKLWGRIAFWVEYGDSGTVAALHQFETHFPDPDVSACVQGVVGALVLPEKPGSPLVFALRVGTPAAPAEPKPQQATEQSPELVSAAGAALTGLT